MTKTQKRYLKIFIPLILLSLFFFLFYGLNLISKNKKTSLIIINDDAVFVKKEDRWFNIIDSSDKEKYNWNKYYVYQNNEPIGKFYLVNNGNWYLFDKDKSAVNYDGDLLAFDEETKYTILKYSENSINDYTYVNKVLSENGLNTNAIFSSSYYIDFDIDNDSINEQLYVITNKFPYEKANENSFGFVFLVKNNRIYYLYKDTSKSKDLFEGCKPYVNSIFDLDEDNKYEVNFSCGYYSTNGTIQKIYKFDKGKFKLLVSN